MAYTPTTWANGDTITAAKLNKLEQGVANGGGGWDLVVKMNDLTPDSLCTFTIISGDTAANLYDKLIDGNPISILLLGFTLSATYANVLPWLCSVGTTSQPDTIYFTGVSSGDHPWPSGVQLKYDSNGISVV